MKQAFISTLAVLFLLLTFSCVDDKKDTNTAPAIDFNRTGNDVIIISIGDADKLNPILSRTGYANVVHNHIFEFLEYLNPTNSKLEPQLAVADPTLEVVKDESGAIVSSNFTYEIREAAKWPNGTPVTAEDYVFSMKTVFVPQVDAAALRPYLENIKSIKLYPDNPRKFTVSTKSQYILDREVISALIAVMPKYYYDPNALLDEIDINDLLDAGKAQALADKDARLQEFADAFQSPKIIQNPVGSGGYELEEWETGQRIVLKKKTDWWAEKLNTDHPFFQAKVDKITYRIIVDESIIATELKAEQADVRSDMSPAVFNALSQSELIQERYNIHKVPTNVFYFLYLNNQDPKLADKRVRKALAHCLNVQRVIDDIYDGSPTPVNGPVHPSKAYYRKDLPLVSLDIEQAKKLLADAGWTDSNDNGIVDKEIDGERVEMELEFLISSERATHSQMALIFAEDAIKAGIKIEAVGKVTQVMRQDVATRNYQITPAGDRAASIAWDPKQRFHSESDAPNGSNGMSFRNDEADRLIDEIQITLDVEKRHALYHEFQGLLYDEQPMLFLFAPSNNMLIHKRFDAEVYGERPGYFPSLFELNL